MISKFKIGDIITYRNNPEYQREVVNITRDSEKWIKGNWREGNKEHLVPKNCYVLKNLKTNNLAWASIKYTNENFQLIQRVKNEPLKWKNYEEVFV